MKRRRGRSISSWSGAQRRPLWAPLGTGHSESSAGRGGEQAWAAVAPVGASTEGEKGDQKHGEGSLWEEGRKCSEPQPPSRVMRPPRSQWAQVRMGALICLGALGEMEAQMTGC